MATSLTGPNGIFNRYAAGPKRYGSGILNAPNIGPTNNVGGYIERDAMAVSKRNALLRRLQALRTGNYMSSDVLAPNQLGRW